MKGLLWGCLASLLLWAFLAGVAWMIYLIALAQ